MRLAAWNPKTIERAIDLRYSERPLLRESLPSACGASHSNQRREGLNKRGPLDGSKRCLRTNNIEVLQSAPSKRP
jgi:hypothetical protein